MKKVFYIFIILFVALSLVACKKDPVVEEPIDTTPPLLFGIADAVIDVGSVFDPLDGVSAIDDVDGTITSNIVVTGTYDVDTAGIYTINFAVEDAAGNPATGSMQLIVRIPPESELYIINGDFSEPLDGTWTHWSGEGGISTATIVDGVLEYDITATGSQWWSSQFSQPNLTIPQGKGFILEFDAKADIARPMVAKIENAQYVGYIDESVLLTTEWQTFQIEFFVTAPTITNGKLIFGGGTMMGYNSIVGALTTIYLDNVKFIELEEVVDTVAPVITGAIDKTISIDETFDPLAGITVSDNIDITLTVDDIVITGTVDNTTAGDYVLIYTLNDASSNETVVTITITVVAGLAPSSWLVANGDFETEQLASLPEPAETGWGWKTSGSGAFTASISGGIATINVTNLGTAPYGVQFFEQNRIIEQGRIYQVTFDAKADIARPIQLALEEGWTRRFDTIIDLTTEWQTYTVLIDHILPGYTNGKFAFFMGLVGSTSMPTTIYLDNVAVETVAAVVDSTAPMLSGVSEYNVLQDFAFDPLQNVKVVDSIDKELTIDDITVTGTVDTATIGDYVLTYEVTDASSNTVTVERTIHVLASADMLDSTLVVVNGDFSTDQSVPYAQPAMDGWGWHGSGTFTVDISGGIMTEVVTNVGTVPHGTQFYQQNLIVETEATYRVTFRAKVDLERSIRFSLESGTTLKNFEIFDVTTAWANYEIVFTIPEAGFSNAKFAFFAGLVEADSPATTFYLDDIAIELVGYLVDTDAPMMFGVGDKVIEEGLEFDSLLGVTVFDTVDKSLTPTSIVITGDTVDYMTPGYYTLTYTLTDRQGNETVATRLVTVTETGGELPSTLKIINGDFAVDQTAPAASGTGWGWHGSGKFMVNIAEGVAKISVYENWTLFYGVQFYTLNREVIEGHTYQITFRAKADDARAIQLNLESGGAKFSAYFDLTNVWTDYTYEYTHSTASITNGKFSFFFGNVHGMTSSTNIYLDDVVVKRIETLSDDTVVPQIWGTEAINWVLGNTFDPMEGIRVYDHVDKELTVDDVTYTGTVNTDVVGDYDLVYTLTDASGNVATYTKVVSVINQVDALDGRVALTDGDFTLESTITSSDSNPGWTLKAGGSPGTFDTPTFIDGAIRINITGVGTVPHSIQFFQRNGFVAEAGGIYVMSFKAKADAVRDIRVSFEETKNWQVLDFEVVGLTTDWATYNVVLSNRSNGYLDVKFGLFLGLIDADHPENSALTAVYFDDVSVQLVGYFKDDVAPMIYAADATVEQDVTFTPMTGVMYGDAQQGCIVVITSDTVGLVTDTAGVYTIDTSVVGNYVLTYTVTDVFGNETIYTRNFSVTAPVI